MAFIYLVNKSSRPRRIDLSGYEQDQSLAFLLVILGFTFLSHREIMPEILVRGIKSRAPVNTECDHTRCALAKGRTGHQNHI